jgi:hypothetical protein
MFLCLESDSSCSSHSHFYSKGFWRWCIILERIMFLDFVHRLQVKLLYMNAETDHVSETSCFLRSIRRWAKSKNTIISSIAILFTDSAVQAYNKCKFRLVFFQNIFSNRNEILVISLQYVLGRRWGLNASSLQGVWRYMRGVLWMHCVVKTSVRGSRAVCTAHTGSRI